jgi:hypothetical protein
MIKGAGLRPLDEPDFGRVLAAEVQTVGNVRLVVAEPVVVRQPTPRVGPYRTSPIRSPNASHESGPSTRTAATRYASGFETPMESGVVGVTTPYWRWRDSTVTPAAGSPLVMGVAAVDDPSVPSVPRQPARAASVPAGAREKRVDARATFGAAG